MTYLSIQIAFVDDDTVVVLIDDALLFDSYILVLRFGQKVTRISAVEGAIIL